MDKFEKHIRENHKSFDEVKADRLKMWDKIEGRIEKKEAKRIALWRRASTRAAVALLLVAGIGLTFLKINSNQNSFAANGAHDQQLMEINGHYDNIMNAKIQLIQNNPNLSTDDKNEFMSFIQELDTEYEELKIEMEKDLDNEKVLEAIIENYRKRIQLMENFLNRLNKTKNLEDGKSIII